MDRVYRITDPAGAARASLPLPDRSTSCQALNAAGAVSPASVRPSVTAVRRVIRSATITSSASAASASGGARR